jgi:hypothetical protein
MTFPRVLYCPPLLTPKRRRGPGGARLQNGHFFHSRNSVNDVVQLFGDFTGAREIRVVETVAVLL